MSFEIVIEEEVVQSEFINVADKDEALKAALAMWANGEIEFKRDQSGALVGDRYDSSTRKVRRGNCRNLAGRRTARQVRTRRREKRMLPSDVYRNASNTVRS